jgi:hypothetical protein
MLPIWIAIGILGGISFLSVAIIIAYQQTIINELKKTISDNKDGIDGILGTMNDFENDFSKVYAIISSASIGN